ncbi:MAG TPA: alpha/beta hydrolase [Telluria sp.]|nr:alpha/beta hydrolase [Telluria sp.]
MRIAAALLVTALVLYTAACIALFAFQRSLIYFPQPRAFGGPGDTQILKADGADLVVSVRPHAGPKALIYFGGNAEDVSASLPSFASAFPDRAIYMLHYRGYGGSAGKPSEASLHADALALFDKVRRDHADIALVGRSLGSGVAVRVAGERPASRLILVTPYDSIEELAARQFPYFPVRWLLTDKFESWRYAPAIRVPTLLLQAERDEVIPGASTERLHAAFAPGVASRIVIRGAGHNTISESPQYLASIRSVL